MKTIIAVMAAGLLLSACQGSKEPPTAADWFHPTVDGKPMELLDYVKKYCTGGDASMNCTKANMAYAISVAEKDPAKQLEKFAAAFPNK